jgi:tetratricopeptide (TPR) repeat protein
MLEAGRVDDAIAAFDLNTERHPDSSNALDSLAEGYYRKGDLDRATQLYRASQGLDPGNENATGMLEKIQGEGGRAPAS